MFPDLPNIAAMDMPVTVRPRKGRGAASNASGRFESEKRVAYDDGWGIADEKPAPLTTTLTVDSTRTPTGCHRTTSTFSVYACRRDVSLPTPMTTRSS